MRNGAYRRRTNRVSVGERQINSARSRQPACLVPKKLKIAPKYAIMWGAILLLLLSIAIGTGGKRKEPASLSAVVKQNDASLGEHPPDAAQSGAVMLKVCVGDQLEEMELEEYILRVVSAEMPASYELEALKAQAVAARTYTLRKKLGGGCQKIEGAEICSDHTHCQAYCSEEDMKKKWGDDYQTYHEKMKQAISQTAGQVLVYEGQPISALYFSSSGGMTESSEHVFGGQVPYLQSVSSPGESDYAGAQTKKEFSYAEAAALISEKYPEAKITAQNAKTAISILSRYESGRVENLKLGETTISGVKARQLFGLRSANFTIGFGSDKMTFETIGYGHGVGMSQAGANAMGKDGKTYQEILLHYYTGVALGNVSDFIK